MKTLQKKPTLKEIIQKHDLEVDWVNTLSLILVFLMAVIGTSVHYMMTKEISWGPWILFFVLYWATGIGITMGYHRLWSHKSFKAHPLVEWVLLILSAMAFQNSAIKWCSDHRIHHAHTDTDKDPYNALYGLWWSHILWILFRKKGNQNRNESTITIEKLKKTYPNAVDLILNPRLRFQDKYLFRIGLFFTIGIPMAFGLYFNNFWEYFFVAGWLRVFMVHHSTFIINSLAHVIGSKPYNKKTTACDSFICALFSFGEGYHNFHHTYPNDYRNGYRFYHFDPTKWTIKGLNLLGLTWSLKRTSRI